MFDKWLLASPSIWWDGRAILELETERAARHDDLDADVFVSVGELEEDGGFDMVANARHLVDTLNTREYPSLRVQSTVLPGDGHSNCIGTAVSNGLRALSRHRP